MSNIRFVLCGLAVWLVTVALPAAAADSDTHYVYTYFLARQAGYASEQARRIASSVVSLDTDPNIGPNSGMQARITYHAFTDPRFKDPARADTAARKQLEKLYRKALKTGSPGIYVHALQDYSFHKGCSAMWGSIKLPPRPDYREYRSARTQQMIAATLNGLRRFRRDCFKQNPPPPNDILIAKALQALHRSYLPTRRVPASNGSRARNALASVWREPVPPQIVYHFDKNGQPTVTDDPPAQARQDFAGTWRVLQGASGDRQIVLQSGSPYRARIAGFDWAFTRRGRVLTATRKLSGAQMAALYPNTPRTVVDRAQGQVGIYLTLALSPDGGRLQGLLQADRIDFSQTEGLRRIVPKAPEADLTLLLERVRPTDREQNRRRKLSPR